MAGAPLHPLGNAPGTATPAGTAGAVRGTAGDRGPNPPEGFRMIVCGGLRSKAPDTRNQDEALGDEHQT
jgi:hypothetical protein